MSLFGSIIKLGGIAAAVANPASAVPILIGAELGGSLFDNIDAKNQADKSRSAIQAAIKTSSLSQYNALITSTQAQIGQQQAVISGIGGSIGAVQGAVSASFGAINNQEGVVRSGSKTGQADARSLAAQNASAIRDSAQINAGALAKTNAQNEALARALSAASGVLYQGTPEIYISDLVTTDAQRVQDIINVGDANANLAIHQGENAAHQVAANAALAIAQLEAQKTEVQNSADIQIAGFNAEAGVAGATMGVINANLIAGIASINANNATYGVGTVQQLLNPPASTATTPSSKVPGVLAGSKRDYR